MEDRGPSPLALVSLFAGIASWTFAPVIGSVGAIIAGHAALADLRPWQASDRRMAWIGLALGYGNVVAALALLGMWLGLFGIIGCGLLFGH
jgi:hypothetical protein